MGQAYICHFEDHWFALRKIGTTWFVLNSLFKSPRIVSETFMELYITQLYTEGFLILKLWLFHYFGLVNLFG